MRRTITTILLQRTAADDAGAFATLLRSLRFTLTRDDCEALILLNGVDGASPDLPGSVRWLRWQTPRPAAEGWAALALAARGRRLALIAPDGQIRDSAWLDARSAALRGDGVGLAAAAGGWLALTAEREGCLIPAKGGAGMDVPLGGAILGRREVIRAALEAAAEENDPHPIIGIALRARAAGYGAVVGKNAEALVCGGWWGAADLRAPPDFARRWRGRGLIQAEQGGRIP